MATAFRAGLAYFLIVFALGFALGTLRVSFGIPLLGEIGAVLIEIPVLLTAAWFVCRWLIAKFAVPKTMTARLAMGGIAFAVLMIAELAFSVLLFGRTATEYAAGFAHPAAWLGLAAQIMFAAFPVCQLRR